MNFGVSAAYAADESGSEAARAAIGATDEVESPVTEGQGKESCRLQFNKYKSNFSDESSAQRIFSECSNTNGGYEDAKWAEAARNSKFDPDAIQKDRVSNKDALDAMGSEVEECTKKMNIAEECCTKPERCFTSPDGEQGDDNEGVIGAVASMALTVGSAWPSSSIGAACGKMKNIANIVTALNSYLAMQCSRLTMACKNTCSKAAAQAKEQYGISQEPYMTLKDNEGECRRFDNASMRLASAAVASQLGAKFSGMCEKLAKKEGAKEEDPFANPDCSSPASASSAICQAKCTRVNAEADPSCAGFFANKNLGDSPFGNQGEDPFKNKFDNLISEDEPNQVPQFTDAAAGRGGAIGGGNGGGGGGAGLGGGGDGGGFGDSPAGEGAQDSGVNTKIERGLASGGGYTSSGGSMRSGGGGGFSGYGGRGAITSSRKPFNLKDFLPGAGKSLPKGPLRGLASVAQDVAPASGDVFTNITRRFYEICLKDRLYDCSTLKKAKD